MREDCASLCCGDGLCVASDRCHWQIALSQSFPVLEVIGAVGGLIFFIFLVVAICSKSKKNWDDMLPESQKEQGEEPAELT